MAQAYSYFLIEYEKVDIFLIQNKDNINHKSFFQKWLIWNIVVEWAKSEKPNDLNEFSI